VGIHLIGPAAATLENVSISNNSLSDTGNGDGTTSFGAINVGINDPLYNLVVNSNNSSQSGAAGIYLTSNADIFNASFSGNTIYSPSDMGIQIDVTNDIFDLSCDRNLVTESGDNAIDLYVSDLVTFTARGNQVNTPTGVGINLLIDGDLNVSLIRENTILNPTGEGIRVELSGTEAGASCGGLQISSNTIRDNRGGATAMTRGIQYTAEDTGGVLVDTSGLQICNNTIYGFTTTGINAISDDGVTSPASSGFNADFFDINVSGNTVDSNGQATSSGSSGIVVSPEGAIHQAVINDNIVRSVGSSGLIVRGFGSLWLDVSISNNSVVNWARATTGAVGAIDFGMFNRGSSPTGFSSSGFNITVAGNSAFLTAATGGATAYGINLGGFSESIRCFSLIGNNVNLNGMGGASSAFRVGLSSTASAGTPTQINVSMVGNNMRNGPITRANANFDPTLTTISANTSDNATDWTAFAATFTTAPLTNGNNNT